MTGLTTGNSDAAYLTEDHMKKLLAIAVLMMSTAAYSAPKDDVPEPATHPDWAVVRENAEAILIDRLFDPESARIKWTRGFVWTSYKSSATGMLGKRRWGWVACGTLNAKNRMGGYAGAEEIMALVEQDGTVRAGESHIVISKVDCGWDRDRFGPMVPELAAR